MARPDKTTAVAELAEDFRTANATVLTEYRGLSVTSMKELRRALGTTTKYAVVKNTLTKIAAKDAGVEIADDLLTGPSAVAFIKGDPIDAAKSLRDFAKENPFLVIKGGFYEGKSVTPAEIMQLANLESREVLLAKLAGAMKGSLAKAARIFDALRIKLELEQGVTEPAANDAVAEVPAPAATAEAVVVTEETTPTDVAEAPVAEATEVTTEATPETEEKE
ncbi:MAG: 50S ribosomal protein L10 [Actinomycetes bacterium]